MLKQEKYKIGILGGVLLFLFIPVIQNIFRFKSEKSLKGAYNPAPNALFTVHDWFEGEYQKKKYGYVNENFGLRTYYLRLNNQLDYKLYNKANTAKLVIGKGGFLFEDDYINAYYGNNFIGKENLEIRFKKLKAIQELLASQGIILEVVFAPGKATFYSEYIPKAWVTEKKISNYEYALKLCNHNSINYIDFNSWFLKQKEITPYDLFSKTGIHWSNYGSLLAMDSLKNHIQFVSGLKLRRFIIDNIAFSDSLLSPDNDLGEAMNLLNDIQPLPMPYANYHWLEDSGAVKPRALFIGDSYFWNIYYQGFTNNFFTDCKFWYYNETVYPESEVERSVKKLNLAEELKKQKVIVLMATECNIHDIGWGFIENVYDLNKEEITKRFRKKIYVPLLIENIKNNKAWLTDVERKAKEKNISVLEMMKLDASYIYETEYSSISVVKMLNKTADRISKTEEWMKDIRKKAKEKGVSIDEMIEMDVKYIYDTELKKK